MRELVCHRARCGVSLWVLGRCVLVLCGFQRVFGAARGLPAGSFCASHCCLQGSCGGCVWRADLWLAAGMALRFQLLLVASTALVFRSGVGFRGLGEARAGGAPPCPVVRCWGLFPVARGSWAGCVRARVPVVCGPSPMYLRSERIRGSPRCRQTFPMPLSASCACYLSCRPC